MVAGEDVESASPSLDSFLRKVAAPLWSKAEFQERTDGWRASELGRGAFGVATLLSSAGRKLALKRMDRCEDWTFQREVRALLRLRGKKGLQQLEAVMVEDEHCPGCRGCGFLVSWVPLSLWRVYTDGNAGPVRGHAL